MTSLSAIRAASARLPPRTHVADILVAGIVEDVLRPEARDDRQIVLGHEPGKAVRILLCPASAADDDDRLARGRKQPAKLRHVGRCRAAGDFTVRRCVGHVALAAQDVLGNGQHHRARPPVRRDMKRPADKLGDRFRVFDLHRPFRHIGEDACEVHLLEGFATDVMPRDLPDDQQHRGRILPGGMHADGGMHCAGAAADHAHAGPSGQLAVRFSHVRCVGLVTARDEPQVRLLVEQRVEDRQRAFSGDAEDRVGAVQSERGDENLAAAAEPCLRRWGRGVHAVC